MTASSQRIRPARAEDLPAIVALYADDDLGRNRDGLAGLDDSYKQAFAAIQSDPNHLLVVGEQAGAVVSTLLLSFLPGLSRGGAWRAQIEAMRVAGHLRDQGLGRELLDWAVAAARARNCALVQLTSDKARDDAHRFYERAGFTPSHIGYKLTL